MLSRDSVQRAQESNPEGKEERELLEGEMERYLDFGGGRSFGMSRNCVLYLSGEA